MIETLEELSKVLNGKKLEGVVKEAASCKDAAAVTALLKAKGIDVSDDCAAKCYEMISKDEELSDDELARTAGGSRITVVNQTCPYCGTNKKLKMGGGYYTNDCDPHFYYEWTCPSCGNIVYDFTNDGYWTDTPEAVD